MLWDAVTISLSASEEYPVSQPEGLPPSTAWCGNTPGPTKHPFPPLSLPLSFNLLDTSLWVNEAS